jgi:hypothetical protein
LAYFKDIMCPYADGYQLPGCADAVSSQTNRNRFPAQKSGKPRDCCVKRAGSDGLRVGRLWAPPRWTYGASQKRVATEYADLEKQVLEYVRRREKMRIALTLLAKGAVALEAKQSPEAGTFLRRVETETGVDLRSIAGGGQSVALDGRSIRRIQELAPTAVTREANSLVSSPGRAQIERQVQEAVASAQERMRSALIEGVSNPKLNGNSTD